ncbi:MAG: hypothetical protein V8R28_07435, partial [Bacteroides cellulosilyticus]
TPRFYRVAAAASVILVLGAASAAFLGTFSPKDEIQEAFTKVATLTPEGNLNGDVVQEKFPSIHETKPTAQNPGHKNPVPVSSGGILAANGDDEETVSVTVSFSITISQRVYGNHHQGNGMYGQTASSRNENNHRATATDSAVTHSELGSDSDKALPITNADGCAKKWAFKAGIGTALPKGGLRDTVHRRGFPAQRHLNKHFSSWRQVCNTTVLTESMRYTHWLFR